MGLRLRWGYLHGSGIVWIGDREREREREREGGEGGRERERV